MTFVRTPATPRKPFGSAPSSLGPPFPPFGLPANQESVHSYLESSTFWNPAQQGGSGDSAEDFKATPLRIWGGSVVDVLITSLAVIDQRVWRYLGARGRKGPLRLAGNTGHPTPAPAAPSPCAGTADAST